MKISKWLLICVFVGVMASMALASGQKPGSCLLFPYYDSTGSTLSIHTITNVSMEPVWVRMVFVDEDDCLPFDMWIPFLPGDTFTFAAHGLLPPKERGFLYAYVVESKYSNLESKKDVLVGQEIVLGFWDNRLVNFCINAATFQALKLVKDGKLRLDGTEYTCAPKTVYFPRFFGQSGSFFSKVILINLTGGAYFSAEADMYIFNDNGQLVYDTVDFGCYRVASLDALSSGTTQAFLLGTNHDPNEPYPFHSLAETGAIHFQGLEATSSNSTVVIPHASIYAVLIEGFGTFGYSAADLPLHIDDPSTYHHAMLWSIQPDGT